MRLHLLTTKFEGMWYYQGSMVEEAVLSLFWPVPRYRDTTQKTTIRAFTSMMGSKTKVFAHTFQGRKPLILSTFTVVFHPRTGFSSTPLRLVLVCPT